MCAAAAAAAWRRHGSVNSWTWRRGVDVALETAWQRSGGGAATRRVVCVCSINRSIMARISKRRRRRVARKESSSSSSSYQSAKAASTFSCRDAAALFGMAYQRRETAREKSAKVIVT